MKHGHSGYGNTGRVPSPEYRSWLGMKRRVAGTDESKKRNYRDRGIRICVRWKLFENFLADMGHRPPEMSLERIDNNRSYGPDNCKWATQTEQARNRRTNKLVTYQGKTQPMSAWSEEKGWPPHVIGNRLRRGWSVRRALTQPHRPQSKEETKAC